MYYIAKITKEDGQWLVEFPDCPGCQTYGNTEAEALEMAGEALDGWLETSLEHGDVPARPKARAGTKIPVAPRLATAIAVRWLRNDAGLNQAQLARRVGVSQQAIAKLEKRSANPTIETLEKIAGKLGAELTVSFVVAATTAAGKADAAVPATGLRAKKLKAIVAIHNRNTNRKAYVTVSKSTKRREPEADAAMPPPMATAPKRPSRHQS